MINDENAALANDVDRLDAFAALILSIPLDEQCAKCGGGGRQNYLTGDPDNPCYECNGSGYTLTPLGEKLLEFFDRHRDSPPTRM